MDKKIDFCDSDLLTIDLGNEKIMNIFVTESLKIKKVGILEQNDSTSFYFNDNSLAANGEKEENPEKGIEILINAIEKSKNVVAPKSSLKSKPKR